jgi:ABC-type lipoprotein export system ATPase subunit
VHDASARTLRRFRRATVGYLFQRPSDNFLPHLTVGEHLRLARGLTHRPPRIDQEALLSTLGIRGVSTTYPRSSRVASSSGPRSPRS